MNILFYGSRGWIGGMILEQWKNDPNVTITCSETRLNFTNTEKIRQEIKRHDRVFMAIGRTYGKGNDGNLINNIDYLEDHLDENLNDNLAMPLLVAIICNEEQVHLTYVGTGCIFSRNTREDNTMYTEEDRPDYFGSSYSAAKAVVDNLMKEFHNHVAVLRIRMPITPNLHPRNFITKILNYNKICSYPNSMTYLPELIPTMIDICVNRLIGTFNMTNPGAISHEEILQYYNNHPLNKKKHNYTLIEEDTLNSLLKSKRSNNILDTSRLEHYYKVRPIRDCVFEAVDKILENN
jgi:dTDP-4-dehydrorhamnose reductase